MRSKSKCVYVITVVVFLLITTLVFTACVSSNGVKSTLMVKFPTGKFVHETVKTWIFQFNEDGTWLYYFDSTLPEVEGTYSIDGNLYTETSVNDPDCPFPATYKWTYDGLKLIFTLVGEEKCGPRKGAYDGQAYIKSE